MSNIWRHCGKSFWVACLVLGTTACEVRATTGKFCETTECDDGFAATRLAEELPTFSGLTLAPYVPVVIEETNDSDESDVESGSDLERGEGDESGEHTNQDSMGSANQQGDDSGDTAPEPSEDDVDSDLDEAEGDVPGHDDAVADLPGDTGSSGSEGNLEDEALADQPEGDNTHAMIGSDESESETASGEPTLNDPLTEDAPVEDAQGSEGTLSDHLTNDDVLTTEPDADGSVNEDISSDELTNDELLQR